jgi:hypothetical protein
MKWWKTSLPVPLNLCDSCIPKSVHIIQNCYGGGNLDSYNEIYNTSWDCDIQTFVLISELKHNRYLKKLHLKC